MRHSRHRLFGSGSEGHKPLKLVYQDGGVWVFKPKTIRNGVVLYGKVFSFRDGHRFYHLKKERVEANQFNYACSCPGSFLGHYLCAHIARFRLAEWFLQHREIEKIY